MAVQGLVSSLMALYLPALPPDAAQFVPLDQEKKQNKTDESTRRTEASAETKKNTSERQRAPNRMTWRLYATVLIITEIFFQYIDAFS